MTLGELVKQIRQKKTLSQPELAELAGIEQSYLSKIENDKSIPSNDIFRRLLSALEIDLTTFVNQLDQQLVKGSLTQISDIEYWSNQREKQHNEKRKRYLYISSVLIVFAITLFFTGVQSLIFSETRYEYYSKGVVQPDEPINIFRDWPKLIEQGKKGSRALREAKSVEMTKRAHEHSILLDELQGNSFIKEVPGGLRLYLRGDTFMVAQPINAWLQIFGVFLFISGIMGFVIEARLSRGTL